MPAAAQQEEPVGEARLQGAIDFRESMGLRDGRGFVKSTFVDGKTFSDRTWGVPLSDDEANDIAERVERQGHLGPAIKYAKSADDFAGMYIDQKDGGLPHFMFTGSIGRHRERIADLLPKGDDFAVDEADRTWKELKDITDRITDDMPQLGKDGLEVDVVSPQAARNAVRVGLREETSGATDRLRDRYGVGVYVEVTGPSHRDVCSGRGNCPDPSLKGGLKLFSTHADDSYCTEGFWGRINGVYHVLTAGHCVDVNHNGAIDHPIWQHPNGSTIGEAEGGTYHDYPAGTPTQAQTDVGWIDANSSNDQGPHDRVYRSVDVALTVAFRADDDEQQEGAGPVCRSDVHDTYWQCGPITATYTSAKDVDGFPVRHLVEVGFDADCGDSGAPFLIQRQVGAPGVYVWGAAGMHSDSSPNGGSNQCGASICSNCYSRYNTVEQMRKWAVDEGTPLVFCDSTNC